MNKQDLVEILKSGTFNWNSWRYYHPAEIEFTNLNLDNLQLGAPGRYTGGNLQKVSFVNCSLKNSNFLCSYIKESKFINCDLSASSFERSRLKNVDFTDSLLNEATFYRAQVFHTDFTNTNLTGANFEMTYPFDLNLKDAKINGLIYPSGSNSYDEMGMSQLHLGMAKNLEFVHSDSQEFVVNYIIDTFEYLNNGLPKYELNEENDTLYYEALGRLTSLHKFFSKPSPPIDLLQTVEFINLELIKMIKKDPTKLHDLGWRAFEELIAEILSFYGWTVSLTSKTRDNGYDIFAVKKDIAGIRHNWLVECKKWSPDRPVGIDIVRSLYGIKNDLRVGNIMLATTSRFSEDVVKYSSTKYDLELKDFQNIVEWVNQYEPHSKGKLYIQSNRLIIP